jgi:hypothetical protein
MQTNTGASTVKLQPVSSIKGMWNGQVMISMMGLERVHIGLKDAGRIQSGVSPLVILSEILKVPQSAITGVKADRKAKTAVSPFSK